MKTNAEINTGFSLVFASDNKKDSTWGSLICSLLLFFGLGGCLWSVLGLSGVGASPLLLLLLGFVGCALSCKLPGRWDFAYVGIILALAILVGTASRLVIEGGGIAMNQIYSALERYIGRSFPRFLVSKDANHALCATLFLIIPAEILAILCGRVAGASGGGRYVLLPFAAALWALALVFEASLPIGCVLALAIAAISLPVSRSSNQSHMVSRRRSTVWILVIIAVLTSLAAIPGLIIINADGSQAEPLRLTAARKIHSMRYDGEHQTLPEGDYGRLPGFVLGEDPALTITPISHRKFYLRGFVGEVYTGDGWTTLSPNRRAQYAELFTWLHEHDFYAQNQYSLLTSALGVDSSTESIQVTNLGVSTAYLYAPYELASNRADAARIGDENLRASGLRGEDTYTITVSGGSISDDDLLYSGLLAALNRDDPRAVNYLTSENAYREFVYDNYLELADAPREAIARLLMDVEFPDGMVSFSDAKMVVNTYFATLGYTETPEFDFAGQDVLTYFLEESGSGNSVNFATAAVMMFRYMGFPARYVEGYLVTPDSETDENDSVILHSKDAYAWAEIYRDGVGFVPFEQEFPAIPPLAVLETMPLNDDVEEPVDTPLELTSRLWITLLAILMLFLLAFIILAVRRTVKRRRQKRLFDIGDNAKSVIRMTAYAIQLLSHMGIYRKNGSLYNLCGEIDGKLGKALSTKYTKVVSIQQAALFSENSITDTERALTNELLNDIAERLRQQSTLIGSLRLRWCACVI